MDRFSTSLRRRNYNNRGLVRHHFVDDPCRITPSGELWAFVQRTYKEGLLLRSADNGFTWAKTYNDAVPSTEDLWYHTSPRSMVALDVQGPIVHLEHFMDVNGIYLFTAGDSTIQYTHKYQFVNVLEMVAQSATFAVIANNRALEGVFATAGYQHYVAIGYVRAANDNLAIDRFSPYDGSLSGAVEEASYNYLNRYDMVANGRTGVCDIVIQSDVGAGAGMTMPVLKTWVADNYTDATTAAITHGGVDYIDNFVNTESKHCLYMGGKFTTGVFKPTLIYDAEEGRYIFQCTSCVFGGNTYAETLDGGASGVSFTLLYAGDRGGLGVSTYEAATPGSSQIDLQEPMMLKGFVTADEEDGNIDGSTDIDIPLMTHTATGRRLTMLVETSLTTEATNAFSSSGYVTDLTIASVFTANGAGNDYTFVEAAITGAGATLWGSDGCNDLRAAGTRIADVGAPSAANNPEPEEVTHASYVDLGIRGAYADTAAPEDVDLILATKGAAQHSIYCRHSASVLYVALLEGDGYTLVTFAGSGLKWIESVFKSNGLNADFTLQVAQLTARAAALWGGDGCNGERTPGGVPTDTALRHVRFDFAARTFGAVHHISGAVVVSVAVARDGYDNLCAVWGELIGAVVTIKYAISKDDGVTWAVSSPAMGGTTTYIDAISTDPEARVDIIGGSDGGFLFMYVRDNGTANRLYVHQISTTDGITYTVGAAQDATSRPATDNIVGGHFFKPCEDVLVPLTIPGFVRIAYQIEEGLSELMLDATPVGFGQELLLSNAFPLPAAALPETAPNQDFYAAGMTGAKTTLYLNAFNTAGTTVRLRQYEPLVDAEMGDRSAYDLPVSSDVKMMVDPKSYGFPVPGLDVRDTLDWIEKDVRKVFLPPDEPLLRTFVLNAGNHLKRTVWTILLDGNEYELSQVVPRFVDDQICFYEVNAYVVGSSHDPWARIVLPSET